MEMYPLKTITIRFKIKIKNIVGIYIFRYNQNDKFNVCYMLGVFIISHIVLFFTYI